MASSSSINDNADNGTCLNTVAAFGAVFLIDFKLVESLDDAIFGTGFDAKGTSHAFFKYRDRHVLRITPD
ncbi:MAG: hypothetical protein ACI97A_001724 [Planctomycetota bacterium]|jgi:hypothetical protein